jgi:hypothetical protein
MIVIADGIKSSYDWDVSLERSLKSQSPGATGFDRMATVTVACPGRTVGLVNHLCTTSTANTSDVTGRVGFNAPLAMAA